VDVCGVPAVPSGLCYGDLTLFNHLNIFQNIVLNHPNIIGVLKDFNNPI
jgi:ABC-type uncharacterized transport system YnjBCD ATPase subunit